MSHDMNDQNIAIMAALPTMACLVIIFKTNGTLNKYLHAQLCNETMPTDGINSVPRREWN